jgi:hypothetical protein
VEADETKQTGITAHCTRTCRTNQGSAESGAIVSTKLYRIYLLEADSKGEFPAFEANGQILDIMEVERTHAEAEEVFYGAADIAHKQREASAIEELLQAARIAAAELSGHTPLGTPKTRAEIRLREAIEAVQS